MDVGMMLQGLSPRVQDGGDAELGAEMPWIGGDGDERLGCRAHQDGIDPSLVLESDLGRRRRQGEDDVEVGHGQKLGLPCGEPLRPRQPLALRAVAVAARNGRRPLRALWALSVMGSWRRSDRALASSAANPSLHYEERLRSSI